MDDPSALTAETDDWEWSPEELDRFQDEDNTEAASAAEVARIAGAAAGTSVDYVIAGGRIVVNTSAAAPSVLSAMREAGGLNGGNLQPDGRGGIVVVPYTGEDSGGDAIVAYVSGLGYAAVRHGNQQPAGPTSGDLQFHAVLDDLKHARHDDGMQRLVAEPPAEESRYGGGGHFDDFFENLDERLAEADAGGAGAPEVGAVPAEAHEPEDQPDLGTFREK